jgi:hypothetical protein
MGQKQVRACLPRFSFMRYYLLVLFERISFKTIRYGQLGIDSVENSAVPTLILKLQLLNVTVVAAGYHHSMCITGDGDA